MSQNTEKYIVADEIFCIKNNGLKWDNSNYRPFCVQSAKDKEPIFTIEFTDIKNLNLDFNQYTQLGDFGEEGLSMLTYKDETGRYCIKMGDGKKDMYSVLSMNEPLNRAILYLNLNNKDKWLYDYSINNSLMIMFAFSSAPMGIMLFHSSTIKYNDYGYMFLGKSGTGKSTHTQLWLKNIKGSTLLNDDNPAVKVSADGTAIVYGTPWSGKTPCYKNEKAKIGGIVKLSQAPHNRIEKLGVLLGYAAVLPTISCMKWEKRLADCLNYNINNLLKTVPIYKLECLPNDEAAKICYNTIKK